MTERGYDLGKEKTYLRYQKQKSLKEKLAVLTICKIKFSWGKNIIKTQMGENICTLTDARLIKESYKLNKTVIKNLIGKNGQKVYGSNALHGTHLPRNYPGRCLA